MTPSESRQNVYADNTATGGGTLDLLPFSFMNFTFKIYASANVFLQAQLLRHIWNLMGETSQCVHIARWEEGQKQCQSCQQKSDSYWNRDNNPGSTSVVLIQNKAETNPAIHFGFSSTMQQGKILRFYCFYFFFFSVSFFFALKLLIQIHILNDDIIFQI